jgi:hypothetical protein
VNAANGLGNTFQYYYVISLNRTHLNLNISEKKIKDLKPPAHKRKKLYFVEALKNVSVSETVPLASVADP